MQKYQLSPFIKWAGGKKQLLGSLSSNMPNQYKTYYEPFIGGGALFLGVQPESAVINDINPQLVNVYRQIKNNVGDVINSVQEYDTVFCTKEYYLKKRAEYNEKILHNILDAEAAALLIWINKHCFNGLYRVNGQGLFNVPYNNKVSGASINVENLLGLSLYLNSSDIQILCADFEEACTSVREGDFVYFDSPYIPINSTAYFTDYTQGGFSYKDHTRLASLFKRLDDKGAYVLLSNHDVPLVYELYKGYSIQSLSVHRNINSDATKRYGQEVLIRNY